MRMRRAILLMIMIAGAVVGLAGLLPSCTRSGPPRARDILAAYDPALAYPTTTVRYPYQGAVFPPESIPPTFAWTSPAANVNTWLVSVGFAAGEPVQALVASTEWTPDEATWGQIKARSKNQPAHVTLLGVASAAPRTILAAGKVTLATSTDPVAAPLFYREVQLPFIEAVKDPARIRWRFGAIDSRTRPNVVLENLPVCGNCHSFSTDGRVLGMDVDYANDKGAYALVNTAREMVLSKDKILSWSSFRETREFRRALPDGAHRGSSKEPSQGSFSKGDKQPTFGLLSQVSPDGRYAVSTVKDRSVFVPKADIYFSQLFFPLKGILAYYDRETGNFRALPGADDPAYVHSNPTWSPDGKFIVFARSKAYELKTIKDTGAALLSQEECREFLSGNRIFRFDLYRIPWNGGKGGKAVPIEGASDNGRSNFFAKYSPDGKWIVYCQANSFMLLQPDSELFIIPAEGGKARRLACNRSRMNSWHSFSPNGRWLVFSSKANTAYTQLFLTHIDGQGQSTPPIVLAQLTAPDRAANIPEFVNLAPDGIAAIREEFVDDVSFMRTALENIKAQDPVSAAVLYRKALAINPDNAEAHAFLGGILTDRGELQTAHEHLGRALELDGKNAIAHYNLGNALAKEKRYEEALRSWKKAIEFDPKNAKARNNIGAVLLAIGRVAEAAEAIKGAVAADPSDTQLRLDLGDLLSQLGRRSEAVKEWQEAARLARSSGRRDLDRECQRRLRE